MIYRIINKGKKFAYLVKNREDFLALRNTKENLENLAKARKGDEKAKAQLVQFAYNIGVLKSSALAGCKSIGSYFFHDVDCYDAEQSAAIAKQILAKKDEIGLMMLEKSASGGYHLVCKRQPGTTLLENQVRIATILQIEMDTNVHDLQRVVYSTSGDEKDLLYLDDELFGEPMTVEECEAEYARLKERERKGEEQVPAGAKKARKHYKPWTELLATDNRTNRSDSAAENTTEEKILKSCSPLQNKPIDERVRFVMEAVLKAKGLEKSDFTDIGGRHNAVKIFLSGCNQLLSKEEANGALAELMPEHWADANVQKCLSDFYAKYYNPERKLNKDEEAIFTKSRRLGDDKESEVSDRSAPIPPEMPAKLPKLIKLLTKNTPNQYKAAVAHAVFPSLGTHLKEVEFEYTDYVKHEATLMNCLMAHTGAGKGCIDEPIRHIMADIKARDAENTRREAEWKKDCQKKGANKDKQVRPEGLVIQEIDPDMTKPALVTRMDEAEGHFVYVKLNEIDLFEQLKGQTGKQHFQLMCLAFDPGAEFGQTRIGTQSVTARPKCRFNWNACTTIQKGRRFFSRVLTDGPISRINFCTIPEMEIGAEQPIYGKYDEAFDAELKTYIDNLVSAHGVVDCPQAFKLAKKLQEECAEFARLSQDETYWNLSHRAIVIAWLKACVLYVANGCQWEKTIEDFVRWSLQYDLWCKMQFFGEDIEKANQEGERIGTRGPRNLLELLPDEFRLEDIQRVRIKQGMSGDKHKCGQMIRQWVHRKYVLQVTDDSFVKSEKFRKR
ncbi:hypothetical protein PRMUPPPA20_04780 [Xylanibacter ruminicola]|uniref:VirE N-terminal domain-containing protein n=2 Tax=Xylanibacter ruminicola TaxID=839 RepID=D5EYV3_XYLR2|nr:hypothetical protein [Xylanibacter ruminicola]ADE82275.1 hypothetical protein PRU_2897 [Xylanibacter ruminicola 23]GJG32369.1 hypothetical protein PRMUPPPA20_04780 [Xylanibacter ruminicola]SEH81035.1 hypothetical protein SAMN02745192_1508 [Xylanibacter ruminicola]